MERKSERSPAPVSEKQPQSNGGGPYTPPPKKTQSGIGKIIATGLLMVVLGGGAFLASKQMTNDGGDTTVSQESYSRKALVQSILALQDEDYDKKAAAVKTTSAQDHSGHGHDHEASAGDPEKAPQPVESTPVAEPESESVVNEEAELKAQEEARKAQIGADLAAMKELSDEAKTRQARAEEQIKKLRDAHNAMVLASANGNAPRVTHAVPFPEDPKGEVDVSALGLYKAILTKCYIGGHDVHWVNEDGQIIEHVEKGTPLFGSSAVARNMINQLQPGLIVIIYEKGYEVYSSDGVLIKRGKTNTVHEL